jgi:hypothetical protein
MSADDVSRLPEGVRSSMWFDSSRCEGRDFLVEANPHTYPGRMTAFCPHDPSHPYYNVSISDLSSCSDESRAWSKGFLIGSEPNSPLDGDGFELDEDSSEFAAWQRARNDYADTGTWPEDAPHRL